MLSFTTCQEALRERLTSAGRFRLAILKFPNTNKIINAKKTDKGINKLLLPIFIILAKKNIKTITMPTIAIGQNVNPFNKAKIIKSPIVITPNINLIKNNDALPAFGSISLA